MTSFETAATVLGALLVGGALLSGLARRSFLSLTAVFVLVGFVLGEGGLEVLEFDPRSGFVRGPRDRRADPDPVPRRPRGRGRDAAEGVAPAAAQARAGDADHGGARRLRRQGADRSDWTEAFLLGALLSPTDPVLSSSVVTNPRVPRRHPPLAQPRVRAQRRPRAAGGARAARRARRRRRRLRVVEVRAPGRLARRRRRLRRRLRRVAVCMPRRRARARDHAAPEGALRARRRRSRPTASPSLPPEGNGFIAVFVCAITLGIRRPDIRECFERRSEDIIEIVKLGVFVVFGSLLTFGGLFGDGLGGRRRSSSSRCWSPARSRSDRRWPARASTRATKALHGVVRARRAWPR